MTNTNAIVIAANSATPIRVAEPSDAAAAMRGVHSTPSHALLTAPRPV